MRKLLLLFVAMAMVAISHAQSPSPDSTLLKEYTGRFVFPDGSQVAEIKVVLEKGVLFATSDQGSSELKWIEKDVFEVMAYTGTATYKRDEKGNINSIYIQIGEMILDGKKAESDK